MYIQYILMIVFVGSDCGCTYILNCACPTGSLGLASCASCSITQTGTHD